jgi:hypothetical protein
VPLGNRDAITDSAQGHDYRAAQAAFERALQLSSAERLSSRVAVVRHAPDRSYGQSL